MKGLSRGRRAGLVSAVALVGIAGAALAGIRYGDPGVTIVMDPDGNGGRAYGTLGGTRNSANSIERISCAVNRVEDPSVTPPARSTMVTCGARDKNNTFVSCTSASDTVADSLNGLAADG